MMRPLAMSKSGSSAVEFALVLPLLLIFLFGIIDVGRLMWTWNKAEKATQMGVRYAVVTDMVPATLASRDYTDNAYGNVPGGDPVPIGLFSSTVCTNTSPCSNGLGYNATAFAGIAARVALYLPEARPANVRVQYDNAGLGFAGDPNGPDVSPLVTVSLTGLRFQPLLFTVFGSSIALPDFRASLTGEDFSGTVSN